MDDGVDPVGKEGAGDRLGRIVVGVLLLFAPQLAGVDQRADAVVVPQQGLGLGAVEAAIGAEVAAALGQFRGLGEGLLEHDAQFDLLGVGGRGQVHRHRDLVLGVGDQVHAVAEPTLDLFPGLTGARIDPAGLVLAPVGVGIGGLPGGAIDPPGAVTLDGLAVVAEVAPELRQDLHQLLAQRRDHPGHHSQRLFQLDDIGEKAREVPTVGHRGVGRLRRRSGDGHPPRGGVRGPGASGVSSGAARPRNRRLAATPDCARSSRIRASIDGCWKTTPASTAFHIAAHRIVVASLPAHDLQILHQPGVREMIAHQSRSDPDRCALPHPASRISSVQWPPWGLPAKDRLGNDMIPWRPPVCTSPRADGRSRPAPRPPPCTIRTR